MSRIFLSLALLMGLILPAAVSHSQEDYKSRLPDGDGKQLTIELCTSCHNLEKVVTSRKTKEEWEQSVNNMITRGATIFPEEVGPIVKYLAKSFPAARQ